MQVIKKILKKFKQIVCPTLDKSSNDLSNSNIGLFAGRINGGTFQNCHAEGRIIINQKQVSNRKLKNSLICIFVTAFLASIGFLIKHYFFNSPNVQYDNARQVGNDTVVIGSLPKITKIGDRSVVVGATDANGNTIINQPMAVGYNAHAGPSSIAIGANAEAGDEKEDSTH